MSLSVLAYTQKLDKHELFAVVTLKAFLLGVIFNSLFMIMVSRVNKELMSITLEMSQCVGQFIGQVTPHVATMPEPVTTIATCAICVTLFLAILCMPNAEEDVLNIGSDNEDTSFV